MKNLMIFAVALVLFSAPAVWAEFLEIEASQIATIEPADKSAGPRIMVQWDLPKDLSGKIIDGAVVTMTVPHDGDEPFEVDVYPMNKSWDAATAKWAEGWEKAGGDFDEELPSPGIVTEQNGGKISADVYVTVKSQIEGSVANFGFILISQADSQSKMKTVSANDAAGLADAKLIIAYRNRR